MSGCSAYGCTNRANRAHYDRGLTFHKFPHSQPERLQKWTANMRRKHWEPSKTSRICSAHFLDECFDRSGQTVRLRPNAEPTVFAFPKHRPKKSKGRKKLAKRKTSDRDSQETAQTECAKPTEPPTPPAPQQIQLDAQDHSYAVESPKKLKCKLDKVVDELGAYKKKLKVEQQKSRRLAKRVANLKTEIDSLRNNQNFLSAICAEMFESTSSGVPQEICHDR